MPRYCPCCVSRIDVGNICPNCDGAWNYRPKEHHLKPGSILNNKYLVGKVLGEGGFGITYVGRDLMLDMKVAIKEYYPRGVATRSNTVSTSISLIDWSFSNSFNKGRDQFITEARTIAKMDKESAVVTVRDFFEENNSGYIVMEFVEGEDLRSVIQKTQKPMDSEELLPLLEPVFSALGELHAIGLIHRDISPDNIMIENGRARLIDFGCARELDAAENADAALKHSFSPIEQYENHDMGPWTDVYAMAATIYYCLTGQLLPKATERVVNDSLVPPTKCGAKLKPKQERALMKALSFRREDRYQTMEQFGKDLFIHKNRGRRIAMIATAAAVLVVCAFLLLWPQGKVVVEEADDPEYVLLDFSDDLTAEEKKKLQELTALLSNVRLVKKTENYSRFYILELENSTGYDLPGLYFRIISFDQEDAQIGNTTCPSMDVAKGEKQEFRFSANSSDEAARIELRAYISEGNRALETPSVAVPVEDLGNTAVTVVLKNTLPEKLRYILNNDISKYTITNCTITTSGSGSYTWIYFYLDGTYDAGPDNQVGYLSFRVLNASGREVDSGSFSLPKMKPGDRFENVRVSAYLKEEGDFTLVLESWSR